VLGAYTVAREFLERAMSTAEARSDRSEVRIIALRLCEVIEQQDFDECHRLRVAVIGVADDS
jgi:hypothetical protein